MRRCYEKVMLLSDRQCRRRYRRICLFSLIFCLLILQYFIFRFYQKEIDCPADYSITTLSFDVLERNLSNGESIVKLNPRILCWIPTTLQRLDRALVIYQSVFLRKIFRKEIIEFLSYRTWSKRCDHSIFLIAGTSSAVPVNRSVYPFHIGYIGNEKLEKYQLLPEKVLHALLYIYQQFGTEYDWFFKADDDTYVIVENLRSFLRRRPGNIPFYYGYVARTPDRFYASGGAGYVLSQEALKQFAEKVLLRPEQRALCERDEAEDVNIAYCLAQAGIFVTNGRDDQQRERFHPMTFEQHYLGNFTRWIEKNAQFPQEKGDRCCSPSTISFHSLSPDQIRMMEFLLYQIKIESI